MSQFIDYTYHSHTARCGHARGTDEEYALAAIKGGYKILGYSDHVMLPGIHQEGMRGDFSLLEDYKKSVLGLQAKYQKQLQIYLAFETEWYYSHFADYYRDLLSKQGFDYLLLGQHCFLMDGDRPVFYGQMKDNATALRMYTSDLIAGMHSGLFLYVCHPDLFREWYPSWDELAIECAHRIIEAAKELDMPLEVNLGCIRWEFNGHEDFSSQPTYPYGPFWDLVAQSGVRVIVGVDSHLPDHLLHSPWDWAENFVKSRHLNYVNRMEIVKK